MNKYYTPALEEMCVGFECEINKKTQSENTYTETWEPIVIDAGMLTSILNIETQGYGFPLTGFRIKYLDKFDIEEVLQTKQLKGDDIELNFQWDVDETETDFYELNYDLETKEMIIEFWQQSKKNPNNASCFTLFQGYIKNKSELVRLLQQLRIKTK